MRFLFMSMLLIFIPAIGRVFQTDGFGIVNKTTSWLIKIPVEGARILFMLFLIGDGMASNINASVVGQ